jgi:hypothetical protein
MKTDIKIVIRLLIPKAPIEEYTMEVKRWVSLVCFHGFEKLDHRFVPSRPFGMRAATFTIPGLHAVFTAAVGHATFYALDGNGMG